MKSSGDECRDTGAFADLGAYILVDAGDSSMFPVRAGTDGGLSAALLGFVQSDQEQVRLVLFNPSYTFPPLRRPFGRCFAEGSQCWL